MLKGSLDLLESQFYFVTLGSVSSGDIGVVQNLGRYPF